MAQHRKVLAAKSDNLSLIPGTNRGKERNYFHRLFVLLKKNFFFYSMCVLPVFICMSVYHGNTMPIKGFGTAIKRCL